MPAATMLRQPCPIRTLLFLAVLFSFSGVSNAYAVATDYLYSFGSQGTADGKFSGPTRIAIGPTGDVYVWDDGNRRIEKFDADGHFLTKWSSLSNPSVGPVDLTVGPDGSVYVQFGTTIERYDANGAFLTLWQSATTSSNYSEVTMDPTGLVWCIQDFITLSSVETWCLRKFDSMGTLVSPESCESWGIVGLAIDLAGNVFYTSWTDGASPRQIHKRSSSLTPIIQWVAPVYFLATDASGIVYGVDALGDAIWIYDNNGAPLGRFGSTGSGPGQFHFPWDIAIGPDSRIYVVDRNNSRIQVFGAAPVPTRPMTWGRIKADYR